MRANLFSLTGKSDSHPLQFIRYILNAADIPLMLFRIRRLLKVQRHFMHQNLSPVLQHYLKSNDGSLDADDIRKIEKYYGLAVPALLGEAFAALRGKMLTREERMAATFLGAATGLYDDLYDKKQLPDDYINRLFQSSDAMEGKDSFEKLLVETWKITRENCSSPTLLSQFATAIHRLQLKTRNQHAGSMNEGDIKHLTFEKGGYSVLLYMSLFYKTMPAEDEQLFYNAGALLQLENDIFDVYKDSRDNISTLVTTATEMDKIRKLYEERWNLVRSCISRTAYDAKGKMAFCKILCAIVSRGFVCLDMLKQRQIENNGIFNPMVFERKKLICDMEKPFNLLKTIHYYCGRL